MVAVQEASSTLRVYSALSKWPYFDSVYFLRGPFVLLSIVLDKFSSPQPSCDLLVSLCQNCSKHLSNTRKHSEILNNFEFSSILVERLSHASISEMLDNFEFLKFSISAYYYFSISAFWYSSIFTILSNAKKCLNLTFSTLAF